MEKKFSIKKYLLYVLAVGIFCIGVIVVYSMLQQKKISEQLDGIINSLTYDIDNNGEEIQVLQDFKISLNQLGHREQAIYYRALTKLYVLRSDMDKALLNFVDAQIHGELAKAYDVIAWLYADTAQIYMDFDSDRLALECIETALAYAEGLPIEDYFYEYCYVNKSELEAKMGLQEASRESYDASLEYDTDDRAEYQSMDLRRNLILANLAIQTDDYAAAELELRPLADLMMELEYPPVDALWSSRIYYPYLTMQTKLYLEKGEYAVAMDYMEEMFATGLMYGQISSMMSFLNDVLSVIEEVDMSAVPEKMLYELEENIRTLVLEYPEAFQNKTNIASTHIYNSNMITVAVFVQKYETERLYWMIGGEVVIAASIVFFLIVLVRKTEKKGRIDGLTGAYIRRHFNKVYEELKGDTVSFGVIMYDIDFFKQINDGFGHEAGDQVLKNTAKLVMSYLDYNAKLFRYGGDEFVIICRKKTLNEMVQLAEKIRSTVEEMVWQNDQMKVTFSMGVAISEECPSRDVMVKVDEKLYESKEAGRNHVSW